MIDTDEVTRKLQDIQRIAPVNYQMAISSTNPTEFFNLKSYVASDTEGVFKVMVPVPFYDSTRIMTLLRHQPAPLAYEGNLEVSLTSPREFLAANREQTLHLEMDGNDLEECQVINGMYICPNQRVLNKATLPTCLFALWQSDMDTAKEICQQTVQRRRNLRVYQLAADTFNVITPVEQSLHLDCEDQPMTKMTIELQLTWKATTSDDKLRKEVLKLARCSTTVFFG